MYDPLVVDVFTRIYKDIAPMNDTLGDRAPFAAITGASIGQPSSIAAAGLEGISASSEEMLTLYDLARSLAGIITLSDAGDVIGKHLRRIVPSSVLVFYIYDAEQDLLSAAHVYGEPATIFSRLQIRLGERLSGWVGANRQTIVNSDPILDLGETGRQVQPRLRSCLSTPLVSRMQLIGVLTLYSTVREAFTDDHRRVVEVVARQVTETVRQAICFERVQSQLLRDAVTGLPNVEHLRRFLTCELGSTEPRQALSLVFISIPGLSDERGGPESGGGPIALIVRAIRGTLRGADLLFRYGVDDFVALLTQTDANTAIAIASRIRSALQLTGRSAGLGASELSIRVGASTTPQDGATLDDLVSAAKRRIAAETGFSIGPDQQAVH
jgi:diguanylate cyclase (GGDEF)-like protein